MGAQFVSLLTVLIALGSVCFLAFIYEPNMQGKFQLKQEQKEQHNLAKTPFDLILASRLKTQISK